MDRLTMQDLGIKARHRYPHLKRLLLRHRVGRVGHQRAARRRGTKYRPCNGRHECDRKHAAYDGSSRRARGSNRVGR